jgi:signal transduction histidine kinase
LSLPLALLGKRLGFQLVDVTADATAPATRYGNLDNAQRKPPPWLVYPSAALSRQLQAFSRADTTLQIVDRQGWLAATAGEQARPAATADTPWLLRALYRAVLNNPGAAPLPESGRVGRPALPLLDETLASGVPASAWYNRPDYEQRKLLVAAAPVVADGKVLGAVLARQSSELYLSLTDRAFSRLLYWSLLAILLSALGLLGYASWLSWRIRRLSRASRDVIRPDGSLARSFPVSQAGDEVGELSRQYAELIERLRDYTDYLRSLSRKLSHELRTPIAVIQSSLDNIDADRAEADVYVARAREGLSRLSGILTAMSEASRLEESVHANTPERYDLAALLRALASAYRDLHRNIEMRLDCEPAALEVSGVPDLVAQMLDKLVDNAASFTPAGGAITLGLAQTPTDAVITVSNDGPLLPAAMQQQLFDSMVSIREGDARMHLGLGLHIVRLIVEFHGGSVRAANRADGSGVVFEVRLPRE